jgi:outer membrane protein OmpA-like peptidoglycan-associated protein
VSKLGLRLHADEEHWIPLSDLMTGLMFLFLLIAIAYMVAIDSQYAKPRKVLKDYAQTRAQLSSDLQAEFGMQLRNWGGSIDPNSLSVRFAGKTGLFSPGSAQLEPEFKKTLDDFFPRYVRIIAQPRYRRVVSDLRIEGFTYSFWQRGSSADDSYMGNMALSQDRARSVLRYVLGLSGIQPEKPWLRQITSADGFSSSHAIMKPNGAEDADASQRVEFHVLMNANEQIKTALRASETPVPQPSASTANLVPTDAGAMPAYPAWAVRLIGKPLDSAFPNKNSRCWGYLDGGVAQYLGKPSGEKFIGWGYNLRTRAPIDRIVLVDRTGRIAGAANGGLTRPDVPATLTWIKSETTGWEGYSGSAFHGPITAWGVMIAPGTICRFNLSHAGAGDLQ